MNNPERDQLRQRYVTGKSLDGAGLDEIADGYGDPVKEMNYITGSHKSKKRHAENGKSTGKNLAVSGSLLWLTLVLSIAFGYWLCSFLRPFQ
jgi:hypothetical protein